MLRKVDALILTGCLDGAYMATISPSPNTTPTPILTPSSPPTSTSPSPPPPSPSQLNSTLPDPAPSPTPPPTPAIIVSPPPLSQPPMASPPPQSPPPQPPVFVPPPSTPPPTTSTPPPSTNPPATSSPPPLPPPSRNPPTTAPPPLSRNPPTTSPPPPPPSPAPPRNAPPPPTTPRESPPPPPTSRPPETSPRSPPPPSSSKPPESPPPPPAALPPRRSSPPPPVVVEPPRSSSPPPVSKSPSNSPQPPIGTPPTPDPPPPPASPPSSNDPPGVSAPPPVLRLSPPPPSGASPVLPSPPLPSLVPPVDPATDNNGSNASDTGSTGSKGIGTGGTVAIGVVCGLLLLGLFGTVVWCLCKRKKKASGINGGYILPTSYGSSPQSDSALLKMETSASNNRIGSGNNFVYSPKDAGGLGNSRSWFTHEELVEATNGFSAQNLLGEGGFGFVYRGRLVDGREVAVKQLKTGGGQGEREFRAEVEIISRIHHRHLVTLVGYCISENTRMLVYDYLPNNNLYFHLHGEGRPVMDWASRVKLAIGAARGLAYLHEDCHPRIIHRDIKSSNILLDNNFEARVSDFGLAKLFQDSNTHVTTRVMGTFGYMAPEYASSGKLTEKSDVFSFGVVLLELITGRKPVDTSQPLGDESLVEWARPLLSHALETEEFEGLVDPRLSGNYVDSEMFRLIEVAAACVRHSSSKRPQMGQVVRAFDTMANSDLTNGMRVGESEIFNSAQQSEEIRLFRRMAFGIQDYSTDFFSHSSIHSS